MRFFYRPVEHVVAVSQGVLDDTRALTGLGIGGSFPLMYSLIGDYYPKERRGSANAVLGLASGLGIAVGQLLAGMLGPGQGWRLPFLCIAVPGMLLNFVFLAVATEPKRGAHEELVRSTIRARGLPSHGLPEDGLAVDRKSVV